MRVARGTGARVAVGAVVGTFAIPLLALAILVVVFSGPASVHETLTALGDGNPEYCLIDFDGIGPDEFFEFDDGRNVRLDPAWCNISCHWYEAPLAETHLLAAGMIREVVNEAELPPANPANTEPTAPESGRTVTVVMTEDTTAVRFIDVLESDCPPVRISKRLYLPVRAMTAGATTHQEPKRGNQF